MHMSKQYSKYLKPSDLSLHNNTPSVRLSFNSSMHNYVKCGWSQTLSITLGTFDVFLIRTILEKSKQTNIMKLSHLTTFSYKF